MWLVWGLGRGRSLYCIPTLVGEDVTLVGLEQDEHMFRCALKHADTNLEAGLINGAKIAVCTADTASMQDFNGVGVVFGHAGWRGSTHNNHDTVMCMAFEADSVFAIVDTKIKDRQSLNKTQNTVTSFS